MRSDTLPLSSKLGPKSIGAVTIVLLVVTLFVYW
jgi:hypothetical protein